MLHGLPNVLEPTWWQQCFKAAANPRSGKQGVLQNSIPEHKRPQSGGFSRMLDRVLNEFLASVSAACLAASPICMAWPPAKRRRDAWHRGSVLPERGLAAALKHFAHHAGFNISGMSPRGSARATSCRQRLHDTEACRRHGLEPILDRKRRPRLCGAAALPPPPSETRAGRADHGRTCLFAGYQGYFIVRHTTYVA